jgi:hypothetical protein
MWRIDQVPTAAFECAASKYMRVRLHHGGAAQNDVSLPMGLAGRPFEEGLI